MPEIKLDDERQLTKEELERQVKTVVTVFRRMDADRCPYCDVKWEDDWCYVGGRESHFLACPKCKIRRGDRAYIDALKQAVNVK